MKNIIYIILIIILCNVAFRLLRTTQNVINTTPSKENIRAEEQADVIKKCTIDGKLAYTYATDRDAGVSKSDNSRQIDSVVQDKKRAAFNHKLLNWIYANAETSPKSAKHIASTKCLKNHDIVITDTDTDTDTDTGTSHKSHHKASITTADQIEDTAIRSDESKTYSTNGDIKARGLHISFTYPETWGGHKGNRAHTLYRVTSHGGKGMESCGLLIKRLALTQTQKKRLRHKQIFTPDTYHYLLPTSGAQFIDGDKTTLDGEPSTWVHFRKTIDRAGIEIKMESIVFVTYYSGKLITLGCSVGGSTHVSQLDMRNRFTSALPVFRSIAASMIIHNQWD